MNRIDAVYARQSVDKADSVSITKMMVAEPGAMEHVKLMFDMYAKPNTSFGDIARYFAERGIIFDGREPRCPTVSYILKNSYTPKLAWTYMSSSKDKAPALQTTLLTLTGQMVAISIKA